MQPLDQLHRPGAGGYVLPSLQVAPQQGLPAAYARENPLKIPELTEHDVVREFSRRGDANTSVDTANLFPLGSCTMIYNPIQIRNVAPFAKIHPRQPEYTIQGALKLLYDLTQIEVELNGMAAGTLQPCAGAHSELAAILMVAEFYRQTEGSNRKIVICPDSAHGTNPATAAMVGYQVHQINSTPDGLFDLESLIGFMGEKNKGSARGYDVAAIMITQPSTFGIYDPNIKNISKVMSNYGAQIYMDGANLIALVGRVLPGSLGITVIHNNEHKTLGVPHGGGGPGAGFVGVAEHLVPYLPIPVLALAGNEVVLDYNRPHSIGSISSALTGNFLANVMAYQYTKLMGADGLREACGVSVLTGAYMHHKLSEILEPAFRTPVMHEGIVIFDKDAQNIGVPIDHDGSPMRSGERQVDMTDLVKMVISGEFYAPTIGFPSIHRGEKVMGSILSEPTHSARKEDIDQFVAGFSSALQTAREHPEIAATAPNGARIMQVDANRKPVFPRFSL